MGEHSIDRRPLEQVQHDRVVAKEALRRGRATGSRRERTRIVALLRAEAENLMRECQAPRSAEARKRLRHSAGVLRDMADRIGAGEEVQDG